MVEVTAMNGRKKTRRTPPKPVARLLESHPAMSLPMVQPEQIRQRIEGGIICRNLVVDMLSGPSDKFRERLLTIEVVMLCMLEFVLDRMPSFLDIVDRLRQGMIPQVDALVVTSKAFYKRLQVIPHQLFLQALESTSKLLEQTQSFKRPWISDLASFASGVYAIDDTTLDALMRRTKLLKTLPKGDLATLAGRLGCAINLATGKFSRMVYDVDAAANEKNHIRPLIAALPKASMFVFDLGYFCFPLFDWITEQGCYFVTRMRGKTSMKVIAVLGNSHHYRDRIIWLGKHKSDRAAHPVRLVEILIDGVWYGYITNVLEPSRLNAHQVWALYSMRWTIEMCFAAVKRALNLAFLRPTLPNAMLIQIWSTLIVYQVLQDLRLEVAACAGWKEDEVSWEMLMRRIAWYAKDKPKEPLRRWLCRDARALNLKKRGTRKRRRLGLPEEVLAELLPPPEDFVFDNPPSRKPRQGDIHTLKDPTELVMVTLS